MQLPLHNHQLNHCHFLNCHSIITITQPPPLSRHHHSITTTWPLPLYNLHPIITKSPSHISHCLLAQSLPPTYTHILPSLSSAHTCIQSPICNHTQIITFMWLPLHNSHYTTTITTTYLCLHDHACAITSAQSPLHYHHSIITIAPSSLNPHHPIATLMWSLFHHYHTTHHHLTITPQCHHHYIHHIQSSSHNHYHIITLTYYAYTLTFIQSPLYSPSRYLNQYHINHTHIITITPPLYHCKSLLNRYHNLTPILPSQSTCYHSTITIQSQLSLLNYYYTIITHNHP
jgi:hypothetical protein